MAFDTRNTVRYASKHSIFLILPIILIFPQPFYGPVKNIFRKLFIGSPGKTWAYAVKGN
jgi:hypothetical protein